MHELAYRVMREALNDVFFIHAPCSQEPMHTIESIESLKGLRPVLVREGCQRLLSIRCEKLTAAGLLAWPLLLL